MDLRHFFQSATLERKQKSVIVNFSKPFRVGSTCQVNGGVRDDISAVFNHQCCEPVGHYAPLLKTAATDPLKYHEIQCESLGLNPWTSVALVTAANMNNMAIAGERFRDLEVVAIATGGVDGNAGRAGDPASFFEENGAFESLSRDQTPVQGTINVILLINKELSKGAVLQAIITATEAKSALLEELRIYSKYSRHLATGTGTDQIAVASLIEGDKAITSAGKHSKLGELIGIATHNAIQEAIELQNQLNARSQCSITAVLSRFGVSAESLRQAMDLWLPQNLRELSRKNFDDINRDPITVATVSCLTHIYDQICRGMIPEACFNELLTIHSAEIAAAVSGRPDNMSQYRTNLANTGDSVQETTVIQAISRAIATGYIDKWRHLEVGANNSLTSP